MEKKGIKETMEILGAVESQADALIASCADGKLTLADLRNEIPVIASAKAAFKDAGEVRAELADLDPVEAGQLYDKILSVGAKSIEALAAVQAVLAKG